MGKSCQRKYLLPAVLAGSPGSGDSGAREVTPPPAPAGPPLPLWLGLGTENASQGCWTERHWEARLGGGWSRLDGSRSTEKDGAEPCF